MSSNGDKRLKRGAGHSSSVLRPKSQNAANSLPITVRKAEKLLPADRLGKANSDGSVGQSENFLPILPHKPSRKEIPPGVSPCMFCSAKCCRYLAVQIDKPTSRRQFDYLEWFLLHEKTAVFVERGSWYLLVYTPCQHLRADNRCGIYERRPMICRSYNTRRCEYEDDWVYEMLFETAEQVREYAEALLPAGRKRVILRDVSEAALGPSSSSQQKRRSSGRKREPARRVAGRNSPQTKR